MTNLVRNYVQPIPTKDIQYMPNYPLSTLYEFTKMIKIRSPSIIERYEAFQIAFYQFLEFGENARLCCDVLQKNANVSDHVNTFVDSLLHSDTLLMLREWQNIFYDQHNEFNDFVGKETDLFPKDEEIYNRYIQSKEHIEATPTEDHDHGTIYTTESRKQYVSDLLIFIRPLGYTLDRSINIETHEELARLVHHSYITTKKTNTNPYTIDKISRNFMKFINCESLDFMRRRIQSKCKYL